MSNRYRASINITVPTTQGDTMRQIGNNVHDTIRAAVDRHCPVARSSVLTHVRAGVITVAVTYDAAGDAEADQIMRDAARETNRPHDALFVVTGTKGRGFRQVTLGGQYVAA